MIVVGVTSKGEEVQRRLAGVGESHMSDVFADWSSTDYTQLAILLPRFVEGLQSVPYRSEVDPEAIR